MDNFAPPSGHGSWGAYSWIGEQTTGVVASVQCIDDESGIAFATEKLESDIARAAEARAEVGVRAQRVEAATTREEDLRVQDLSLKSTIQDLDVTAAAIRFSQLQQQLQAGLSTAGRITNLTLLDFLR